MGQPMTREYIRQLVQEDRLHQFYTSWVWLQLRSAVLAADHGECQVCKKRGKYTRATTVHHVRYVRQHPELALSQTFVDSDGQEKRNLISLCHNCHEEIHGYRHQGRSSPLTQERW